MALVKNREDMHGNSRVHYATHTFSSSYVKGGDAADPGMKSIDLAVFEQGVNGVMPEYDYTNKKVKAKAPSGPIKVEEVVAVATNTGTLAEVPAYIVAVEVTAGSVTGAFDVIPTGETPLTKQVDVNFVTGALTFLAGDAVTSCRVTYAPQRNGSFFGAGNLTVDETAVASASKVNLAARAACVQYVYDTTGGTMLDMVPPGDPPGSGECAVDINDSGNTSIDTNVDIDGNSLKVTYLAHGGLPSPDAFIDDTDVTLSTEAWNFVSDGGECALIVPAMGTKCVGEAAAAANALASWVGPSGTAGNDVARWRPAVNDILTNQTAAMLTTAIPWVRLAPQTFHAGVGSIGEIDGGTDLSGVSVKAIFYGT